MSTRYGWAAAALMGAIFALSAPAGAGMPYTKEMTCPVGGEKFSFTTTASYTIFGSRPDGKPFGSWTFPLAMPECPGNGLVVFDEFTDADKITLASVLKNEDYQAARKADTSYYRAMWLARAIGRDVRTQTYLLRQAIWQTDDDLALRKRYFAEYLALAPTMAGDKFSSEDLWLNMSFANAERELGRFDAAWERLAGISLDGLRIEKDSDETAEEMTVRYRNYAAKMSAAIARRDDSIDPIDMMDDNRAAFACRDKAPLSDLETAWCARPEIQTIRARWKD